jgi:hypothetical protein
MALFVQGIRGNTRQKRAMSFFREKLDVLRNDRVNEDCSVSCLIAWRRSIGRDIEHSLDYSNRRRGRLAGPYTASSRKRPNPIVVNRKDVAEKEDQSRASYIRFQGLQGLT